MAMAGEILADQNGIVAGGVQPPVSFVAESYRNSFFAMQKSMVSGIKAVFRGQHPRVPFRNCLLIFCYFIPKRLPEAILKNAANKKACHCEKRSAEAVSILHAGFLWFCIFRDGQE